jgi:hypothetical protein
VIETDNSENGIRSQGEETGVNIAAVVYSVTREPQLPERDRNAKDKNDHALSKRIE